MPPLKAVFKTCTPGTAGCGWKAGDMETFTQNSWGDELTDAGAVLLANFNPMYPDDLTIGGTYTLRFTQTSAIYTFLPTVGSVGVLTASLVNPQTTAAGELAGQVLALQLNVDFSTLLGNAVELGSVRICKFTSLPVLNGQTIDQFLATPSHILGGGGAAFSATTATAVARILNDAFVDAEPTSAAQLILVAGACPAN